MDEIREAIERLAELSADELSALVDQIDTEIEARLHPDDGKVVVADVQALNEALAAVNDRIDAQRTEAAENDKVIADLDARRAELVAKAKGDTPAEAEPGLSDEDAAALEGLSADELTYLAEMATAEAPAETVVTEPEAPAAETAEPEAEQRAAAAPRVIILPPNRPVAQPEPAPEPARTGARLFGTDTVIDERRALTALQKSAQRYGRRHGFDDRVLTVDLGPDTPRMEGTDLDSFLAAETGKLREYRRTTVASADADVRAASGALCAPPRVDYSLPVLGDEDQPIGSLFPRLAESEADAAKTLRFFPSLEFNDLGIVVGAGLGSATATQNESGANYPKTAVQVACPDDELCEQRGAWLELLYDNLSSMAWPEFNAAIQKGGRIALAAYLEKLRLQDWYDAANGASQVLTPIAQPGSANHSILTTILSVVTYDRSAKRDQTPYVVAAPEHIGPQLALEVAAAQDLGDGLSVESARVEMLRRYNVTVAFYRDGFGITSQARHTHDGHDSQLPAISTFSGAVPQFPCQARLGIARDDAAFNRQGAELNIGVTRVESDLEDNLYRTFYETWQRLCFRTAPFVADVQVNPNAATSLPVAFGDECYGSGS